MERKNFYSIVHGMAQDDYHYHGKKWTQEDIEHEVDRLYKQALEEKSRAKINFLLEATRSV